MEVYYSEEKDEIGILEIYEYIGESIPIMWRERFNEFRPDMSGWVYLGEY